MQQIVSSEYAARVLLALIFCGSLYIGPQIAHANELPTFRPSPTVPSFEETVKTSRHKERLDVKSQRLDIPRSQNHELSLENGLFGHSEPMVQLFRW